LATLIRNPRNDPFLQQAFTIYLAHPGPTPKILPLTLIEAIFLGQKSTEGSETCCESATAMPSRENPAMQMSKGSEALQPWHDSQDLEA
jgi:hypothetical protein